MYRPVLKRKKAHVCTVHYQCKHSRESSSESMVFFPLEHNNRTERENTFLWNWSLDKGNLFLILPLLESSRFLVSRTLLSLPPFLFFSTSSFSSLILSLFYFFNSSLLLFTPHSLSASFFFLLHLHFSNDPLEANNPRHRWMWLHRLAHSPPPPRIRLQGHRRRQPLKLILRVPPPRPQALRHHRCRIPLGPIRGRCPPHRNPHPLLPG